MNICYKIKIQSQGEEPKSTRAKQTKCIPAEREIYGDTPHPHRAVSELISKHFTVLYIGDFQQKTFYGVMEGRSFTKYSCYSDIIRDCTIVLS